MRVNYLPRSKHEGDEGKEPAMLHKCANSTCSSVFRYLSQGKLYQVETEFYDQPGKNSGGRDGRSRRRVEHYWLCDECSSFLTLAFEKGRGMIVVPLPQMEGRKKVTPLEISELPQGEADVQYAR